MSFRLTVAAAVFGLVTASSVFAADSALIPVWHGTKSVQERNGLVTFNFWGMSREAVESAGFFPTGISFFTFQNLRSDEQQGLYLCKAFNRSWFLSNDPGCEGQPADGRPQNGGIIGWTLRNAGMQGVRRLVRYNSPRHGHHALPENVSPPAGQGYAGENAFLGGVVPANFRHDAPSSGYARVRCTLFPMAVDPNRAPQPFIGFGPTQEVAFGHAVSQCAATYPSWTLCTETIAGLPTGTTIDCR